MAKRDGQESLNHAQFAGEMPRWLAAALATLVFAGTFVAFVPALRNGFLNWDDDANFTNNQSWRGLGGAQLAWMFTDFYNGHYTPITWLTLGLDYEIASRVFGDDPRFGPGMDGRVYHASNVIYHAINAVLVYLVALRLIGSALQRDMRYRSTMTCMAAAIAALLWSVHPLRVENVAWITERRDVVGATLMLASVLAYLRSTQFAGGTRGKWLAISAVVYLLSLMGKVSAVPLPVVLLAMDWHPLRRLGGDERASAKSVWLEKLPYFAAALVFAYIASRGQSENRWMYPLSEHPLDARILVTCYGLVFYVWKTLWPVHLLPLYELQIPMDKSQAKFAIAIMLVAIGFIALLVLAVRRKWPGLIVAMLCYAAFLGPVLGLFQNGPQIAADRYAYLPSIGLMILLGGGAAWWLSRKGSTSRCAAAICGLAVVALLGAMSWNQSQVWQNSESLWTHQLEHDQDSAIGNMNLGLVIALEKRTPAQAIPYFRRAIAADPYSKKYRQNLRMALREAGMFNDLVQAWLDEAAAFRGNPNFEFTSKWHLDAGTQAIVQQNHNAALEHLTVSVSLDDKNALAYSNLGVALERLQQWEAALDAYRRAIAIDPKLANPRFGLALMLSKRGQQAEAIHEAEELLRLNPGDTNAKNLLNQLRGQR